MSIQLARRSALWALALMLTGCPSARKPQPTTTVKTEHIGSARALGTRSNWGIAEIERAVPQLMKRCLAHAWLQRRAASGRRPTIAVLHAFNRLSQQLDTRLVTTGLEQQVMSASQVALWKPTDGRPDVAFFPTVVGIYRADGARAERLDLLVLELVDVATGEVLWHGVDERRRMIRFADGARERVVEVKMQDPAARTVLGPHPLSVRATRDLALRAAEAAATRLEAGSAGGRPLVVSEYGVEDRTDLGSGHVLSALIRQHLLARGALRILTSERPHRMRELRDAGGDAVEPLAVEGQLSGQLLFGGPEGDRHMLLRLKLFNKRDRNPQWSVEARAD